MKLNITSCNVETTQEENKMKKSMENLIKKVIKTTGNKVRELEKVSFSNGLIIDDVIECGKFLKNEQLFIVVDSENDIVIYGDNGICQRVVYDDSCKTQIEKAVCLTMALNQLGF